MLHGSYLSPIGKSRVPHRPDVNQSDMQHNDQDEDQDKAFGRRRFAKPTGRKSHAQTGDLGEDSGFLKRANEEISNSVRFESVRLGGTARRKTSLPRGWGNSLKRILMRKEAAALEAKKIQRLKSKMKHRKKVAACRQEWPPAMKCPPGFKAITGSESHWNRDVQGVRMVLRAVSCRCTKDPTNIKQIEKEAMKCKVTLYAGSNYGKAQIAKLVTNKTKTFTAPGELQEGSGAVFWGRRRRRSPRRRRSWLSNAFSKAAKWTRKAAKSAGKAAKSAYHAVANLIKGTPEWKVESARVSGNCKMVEYVDNDGQCRTGKSGSWPDLFDL